MNAGKVHHGELSIDITLVQKLLEDQFPQWADLKLQSMHPEGTDNRMFKLGEDMVVRLPRFAASEGCIHVEINTLNKLEAQLPLPIPNILAVGQPNKRYPFTWVVMGLLSGEQCLTTDTLNEKKVAKQLAKFIQAMQLVDVTDIPQSSRGGAIQLNDAQVRAGIEEISTLFDASQLTRIWNKTMSADAWDGTEVWIHSDLHPGNLLVEDHEISAIVDFGMAGVGDPAVDLMPAWTIFTEEGREIFKKHLPFDESTWDRARGWALKFSVLAYPYYRETLPEFAAIAKRVIERLIEDFHDVS